jgi:hypothetical protein
MNADKNLHYWSVWYPKAAATGMHLSRCLIDPQAKVLLHAAPDVITVEVHDQSGTRIAYGIDLKRSQQSPICLLRRDGDSITREDLWPTDEDLGTVVLLPGGEAGILQAWWNAPDHTEWRWQVEFYNSTR